MLRLRAAAVVCACGIASLVPLRHAAGEPEVTGRIDVPAPGALALNPHTDLLYVAGLREVPVVDLEVDRVVNTIDVRGRPSDVAVNRKTDTIYVTSTFPCSTDCPRRGLLSVIDASADQVVSTIRVGKSPGSVAVNLRTNQIFVANYNSENVSVVDGTTNEVVSVLNPKLGYPVDLAVDHLTNRLYVTGMEKLSVLDISDGSIVWTGGRASGYTLQVEVDARGNRVYLTDEFGKKLWILEGSSHRVVGTIRLPQEPLDIVVDPPRDLVHVTTWPDFYSDEAGELVAVDTSSFEIVTRTPVGEAPSYVEVNSRTSLAYVSEDLADTVWIVGEASESGGGIGPPETRWP